MTNFHLSIICEKHSIPTCERGGQLFALDLGTGPNGESLDEWVEVTGWTKKQILAWIGY